ncbi:hypothetical protein ACH5RR_002456 [Cinchona calisaya]|uniref:RING-type domain-containing protein n=1 Tax=Cinchona calisaya TaxID=153742 RepID=A0ABD3B6V9_9GENT
MAVQAHLYSENLVGFPLENGCGLNNDFCVNLQQQQKHHIQTMQQHHRLQDFRFDNTFLRPDNQSMVVPRTTLESQIEKNSKEIDLLFYLQNERLRLALQEQWKQQIVFLLKNYEAKAQFLLQLKDEEIATAMSRTIELEDLVKKMETENQMWQRVAKENEEIIISLNNTMDQLREGALSGGGNYGVEDAGSCCEILMDREQTREQKHQTCRMCNSRSSCVILLPCRHLCSCNVCEAIIESCPVCNMVKKSSIEVFI